jgi:hypothetical protein
VRIAPRTSHTQSLKLQTKLKQSFQTPIKPVVAGLERHARRHLHRNAVVCTDDVGPGQITMCAMNGCCRSPTGRLKDGEHLERTPARRSIATVVRLPTRNPAGSLESSFLVQPLDNSPEVRRGSTVPAWSGSTGSAPLGGLHVLSRSSSRYHGASPGSNASATNSRSCLMLISTLPCAT